VAWSIFSSAYHTTTNCTPPAEDCSLLSQPTRAPGPHRSSLLDVLLSRDNPHFSPDSEGTAIRQHSAFSRNGQDGQPGREPLQQPASRLPDTRSLRSTPAAIPSRTPESRPTATDRFISLRAVPLSTPSAVPVPAARAAILPSTRLVGLPSTSSIRISAPTCPRPDPAAVRLPATNRESRPLWRSHANANPATAHVHDATGPERPADVCHGAGASSGAI
jgi:hypothetical protein